MPQQVARSNRRTVRPMPKPLSLKHLTPIAVGSTRLVFRHPENSDLVVKVVRPELIAKRFGERPGLRSRLRWTRRRARQFIYYRREIQEHLALHARGDEDAHALTTITGFIETDMGLGFLARAVRGRDGDYAPTLETLVCEKRFSAPVQRDFARFVEQVRRSEVLVSDLNPRNIVYGHDNEHGDHFVLVDGLGEKTLIPVKAMSRLLNRYSKWKHIRRLHAEIERLTADPSARRGKARKLAPQIPAAASKSR